MAYGGPAYPVIWLAALSLLLAASEAGAYCRTRTCEFGPEEECPTDQVTGCSTQGRYVFWADSCIPFAVQRDGSAAEGIGADALEQLTLEGFESWSLVACTGGGSPELAAGSQGLIACDAVEYDCNVREANKNLVTFRDTFEDGFGLRYGVIALTTLTANLSTGELFDADIEINSRDEDFVLGNAPSFDPEETRGLRGVVTHELGHLLGLSHSTQAGALMRANYEGTAAPGDDDARGVCDAFGRATSDPVCDVSALPSDTGCVGRDTVCTSQRSVADSGGCSCRLAAPAEPSRLGWAAAAALALVGCRRQGRQSRRRQTVL